MLLVVFSELPLDVVVVVVVTVAVLVVAAVVIVILTATDEDDDAITQVRAIKHVVAANADVEVEIESTMLKKAAATLGFEDKSAAERFPPTQPPSAQALTVQHPQNGGLVSLHVYHRDPAGHS